MGSTPRETKPISVDTVDAPPSIVQTEYVPTGPDAIRASHVQEWVNRSVDSPSSSRPFYDSVVVVGAGLTASIFAARLARSKEFAGNIVVTGRRKPDTRKLSDGASLRGAGLDWISYALGVPSDAYLYSALGPNYHAAAAARQISTAAYRDKSGEWKFTRVQPWISGRSGRVSMYAGRNTSMQRAVYDLMKSDAVIFNEEDASSLEHAQSLAPGRRPLIVNTSTNPRLLGADTPQVKHATLAWQAPLKEKDTGLRAPIQRGQTFFACNEKNGAAEVGFWNPFADPLSPNSIFYGIYVRPVTVDAGLDTERELAVLRDQVIGVSDAVGLEVDDEDETAASVFIPGLPWRPARSAPGTLELRAWAHPGVAALFADGITSGAVAAVTSAEAILRGADPDSAIQRSNRRLRRKLRAWHFFATRSPKLTYELWKQSPATAMYYTCTNGQAELWASAA